MSKQVQFADSDGVSVDVEAARETDAVRLTVRDPEDEGNSTMFDLDVADFDDFVIELLRARQELVNP